MRGEDLFLKLQKDFDMYEFLQLGAFHCITHNMFNKPIEYLSDYKLY